jgi:hypothetical protein
LTDVLHFLVLYIVSQILFQGMLFCRTIKFWFLVLIFPRKGQSRLILLLLVLKPPRLTRARMEMMPKNLEKRATRLRRLPLLTLKTKMWREKGSAQET